MATLQIKFTDADQWALTKCLEVSIGRGDHNTELVQKWCALLIKIRKQQRIKNAAIARQNERRLARGHLTPAEIRACEKINAPNQDQTQTHSRHPSTDPPATAFTQTKKAHE